MNRFASLFLSALICLSVSALASTSIAVPSPSPSPVSSVDPLKAAVIDAQSKLGPLDPAQKRIFDEEVVPQYALFVRDYKRVGSSLDVELDLDGIKNTVRFSAQKSLNQPLAKVLLYLDADPRCPKCLEDAAAIKRHMQLRVERRGMTPVWLTSEELTGTPISDLVGPRGTLGYLKLTLIPAPKDDIEHEDENRFIARLQLDIRGVTTYEDEAELFDTGSFEAETQKLLTHAFSALGAKADLAGISTMSKDDLLVQLSGISGYAQYARLKDAIQARLKGVALVDQRKISRGHAVLALRTKKSVDEVKALLSDVTTGADKSVQMEIHP